MQPLEWEYRPDGLRAPALICAFKGWNDAADAASSAITFVAGALGAQRGADEGDCVGGRVGRVVPALEGAHECGGA